MENKEELLTKLEKVYNDWEQVLAGMSEEEIIARHTPSDLSVKDGIGHLRAWQQRSITRMEAALDWTEPLMPEWSAGMTPQSEGKVDEYNATIYQIYRDQLWSQVHGDWSAGFLRFLELAQAVDEEALFEVGMFPWLPDYALADVLKGSWDHHQEHLDGVLF